MEPVQPKQQITILLHGDGSALWVSCHRDDVALAFAKAAGNPVAYGKAYNVTGSELLTWKAYWQAIARALNTPEPRFVCIPTDLLGEALPNLASWCVTRWEDAVRGMIEETLRTGGFENSADYPFYDRLIDLDR